MQQQYIKEMLAVVFTFIVMGVIGFSIYEIEDTQVMDDASMVVDQGQAGYDDYQQVILE